MNFLTAENITKSFGEKNLFHEISFSIESEDKIGLIGVNGTGKSTLLKIIAGQEMPDSGSIVMKNGIRIGYLPQEPIFDENSTVIQQVFHSDNKVLNLIKRYEAAMEKLEKDKENKVLQEQIAVFIHEIDKLNVWDIQSEAKTILTKLGITEFHKPIAQLSGGQKKRVAMARTLITPVDILILDEPTNHIDNATVDWLEKYLSKYSHALLMVTHDRYFLDRVVNKTLELEKGNLYCYEGNYSKFLELKTQREELEISGERKRQNFLRTELEWVRRGAQARSTKQKARLQRFEEISGQKAPEQKSNLEINVGSTRLGRKTIELKDISKQYEGISYVSHFSYMIVKDDRIGIIGPNGCGKSTLIKMIIGQLEPDSGVIEKGETVKIGIFAQENEELSGDEKVIDVIKNIAEYVPTSDGRITASQMLEKFLFTPDTQWSPVSKLSGGEKRRLYLLKVLMGAPNILFLDEPTNDLDIETLAILESYLDTFPGAVITVSHDRYYLDRVVNRIFSFEGNGIIKQYEGGYTDYSKASGIEYQAEEKKEKLKKEAPRIKERERKLSYKEQKELNESGDSIGALEQTIEQLKIKIENTTSDYIKLQELTTEKEKLETELEEKMERWLYLTELQESIEAEKR